VQQDEVLRHAVILSAAQPSQAHRSATLRTEISSPTDTYLLLRAFVEELARCGMRDACTSPGSRCTPLALSLVREERLRCYSHIDERCSGFFALGLAKASGRPVAVTCTSGTALAELLPAVIEAREAGVPLVILSADRPPELRESGAGQTIDQVKLFGESAKWFFEVGVQEFDLRSADAGTADVGTANVGTANVGTPDAGDSDLGGPRCEETVIARLCWMRTLACRAYWRALEDRPGVVHLNFPLREPLVTDGSPLPLDRTGRRAGAPYVRRSPAQLRAADGEAELRALLASARRGVLVAGRHERDRPLGAAAAAFCEAAGWPLLADPLAGARRGEAAVAHYDALLRDPAFASEHRPDLVIRVGDLPTSKPLREWLAGLGDTPQATLDEEGSWQDPAAVLAHSLAVEPAQVLAELAHEPGALSPADPDWLGGWRSADELAAEAILGVLAAGGLSEPTVAAELGVLLPSQATLFVASSMPVRDIETFWPVRPDPPRVLCNRGANGIDGTVSSAFGVAADGRGPVVLLIGDVALAHDIGGLLAARRLELALTIVLIDNGGGGIFDFLPVSTAPMARAGIDAQTTAGRDSAEPDSEQDIYTRHVATPTGLDFAHAAQLYGLAHECVADVASFREALERALTARPPGARIVEVRGERAENVELHRRVWAAVSGALAEG
jgi:2-succinyl-5-enolpyruvyl-6-hydroxy-3-cyclohexene-1-carboxylate synthase